MQKITCESPADWVRVRLALRARAMMYKERAIENRRLYKSTGNLVFMLNYRENIQGMVNYLTMRENTHWRTEDDY